MAKRLENCRNCEQLFNEKYDFCPYCGQQSKDELTFNLLFCNTISNYFSFDARFFKSFFPLLFKPGYLAAKFIEGKRLLYLHPAQMYLFVAVVFFFLFSFIQRSQVKSLDEQLAKSLNKEVVTDKDSENIIQINKEAIEDSIARMELRKTLESSQIINGFTDVEIDSMVLSKDFRKNGIASFDFETKPVDSLIALGAPDEKIYETMGMSKSPGFFEKRLYAQALKFYKSRKGGSILQEFYDTIPIAMFFLLPIFAFILKIFFRKKGVYAHHLVFSFYYFSFLFTAFSLIIGVNFIFDIPGFIDFLMVISTFIYLLYGVKRFYGQTWFKSIYKSSLTTFLFLSFVAPLAVVIISVFAFLFY